MKLKASKKGIIFGCISFLLFIPWALMAALNLSDNLTVLNGVGMSIYINLFLWSGLIFVLTPLPFAILSVVKSCKEGEGKGKTVSLIPLMLVPLLFAITLGSTYADYCGRRETYGVPNSYVKGDLNYVAFVEKMETTDYRYTVYCKYIGREEHATDTEKAMIPVLKTTAVTSPVLKEDITYTKKVSVELSDTVMTIFDCGKLEIAERRDTWQAHRYELWYNYEIGAFDNIYNTAKQITGLID